MTFKKWLILLAISLGVFMSLLDVTVVNVALPAIQKNFSADFGVIQWILNGYTIAFAIALLIMSNLGDRYGKKRIFMISLLIFTISSLGNALSPNIHTLILSRIVQGIGGAGLMSLAMSLVATIFDGKTRALAISIVGSVIGFATASGPLVGGVLIDIFGWQSIFLINIPIGLLSLLSVNKLVTETETYHAESKIDYIGMLLSAIFLFSAIFGLIQKEENLTMSWMSFKISGWLVLSLISLTVFFLYEHRISNPVIDFKLLKDKHIVGVLIVAFVLGFAIYSYSTFLTILMQNYMSWTPLKTGVNQLFISIWSLIIGPATAMIGTKFQKKFVTAFGLLLAVFGFMSMNFNFSLKMTLISIVPTMILIGLCNAFVNPMINTSAMEYIEKKQIGTISGLLNVARQLGTSFGIAVLGIVQSAAYNTYLDSHTSAKNRSTVAAVKEAGPFVGKIYTEQSNMPQNLINQSVRAYNHALYQINIVTIIMVSLAIAISVTMIRKNKN